MRLTAKSDDLILLFRQFLDLPRVLLESLLQVIEIHANGRINLDASHIQRADVTNVSMLVVEKQHVLVRYLGLVLERLKVRKFLAC